MDKPFKAPQKTSETGWRAEPTLPKQRAVLEFLKLPVPPTQGGASNMIAAVFEGPAGNSHQNAWDAAKSELHPDLFPPAPPKEEKPSRPQSGSSLGFLLKAALLVAVLLYAWMWYQRDSDNADSSESQAFTTPAPTAPTGNANPPVPQGRPVSDWITLQSTDGKTIQAKVLALTKETVLIRRDDGQTFDLPIARLTADSKQRIDEYRAAKRAGLVK